MRRWDEMAASLVYRSRLSKMQKGTRGNRLNMLTNPLAQRTIEGKETLAWDEPVCTSTLLWTEHPTES